MAPSRLARARREHPQRGKPVTTAPAPARTGDRPPLLDPGGRGRVADDPAVPGTGLWSQVNDQLEVEP
jgi:hypothetical protein